MSLEAAELFEGNVKDDDFGKVVSISGEVLIVGAPGEDANGDDAGAAYVYLLSSNVWTLDARLVSSDIAAGDRFGNAVKVAGDYVIVGADGHDDGGLADTGAAYIFRKSAGSWNQEAKLIGNDTMAGDKFGVSVGISESYAVVGADWHTGPGGVGSGAAYIFSLDGSTWKEEAQLVAKDAEAFDRFGGAVGIDGSTVIVGALESEENGAAYVFERSEEIGPTWTQMVKYVADANSNSTDSDRFGSAVAVSGTTAVVGAFWDDGEKINGGAAYIYTRNASGWGSGTKIFAPDGATEEDRFGISVDVSGNTMIVGAYFDSDSGLWSGSAYIFAQLAIDQWSYQEKVVWSQASAGQFFGRGVSIWDSNVGPFTAVVGAPGANRSIVVEGGLPTTSTTTTKTSTSSSTSSATGTSSSTVSSSSSITSSSSVTSTTSMTSITETVTSLTSSSTSLTATTSTSSSVTRTTSTSSSVTLTTSTVTLTTKTTKTETSTSETSTSMTSTSRTSTSDTSTSSISSTKSSTETSRTLTSVTDTSSSSVITSTATTTRTISAFSGDGGDGDGSADGDGNNDGSGDNDGDDGSGDNDGDDGSGDNDGDSGDAGDAGDTDGHAGDAGDGDGDGGKTVTVKEDFGSGTDPSGSWTWEEFESSSLHCAVPLFFFLGHLSHWI